MYKKYKTVDTIKVGTILRINNSKNCKPLEVRGLINLGDDYLVVFSDVNTEEVSFELFPSELSSDSVVILGGIKEDTGSDSVSHPHHYTRNSMECLDFITHYDLDYYVGNAVKYVWRHKYKNGREDLEKAIFYLTKRLEIDNDSWNKRDETFKYQPIDTTKLEDLDSVQLAILYSLSLLKTLEYQDKIKRIKLTLGILKGYIDEGYNI